MPDGGLFWRRARGAEPVDPDVLQRRLNAGRVPPLSEDLRDLLDALVARVPLDDLIDEHAVRFHGDRRGPPPETDVARPRVYLVRLLSQLRAAL